MRTTDLQRAAILDVLEHDVAANPDATVTDIRPEALLALVQDYDDLVKTVKNVLSRHVPRSAEAGYQRCQSPSHGMSKPLWPCNLVQALGPAIGRQT